VKGLQESYEPNLMGLSHHKKGFSKFSLLKLPCCMNMFCYLSSSPPTPLLFPPSFLITCVCNIFHKNQAPLADGGGGPKTNWQEQKSDQMGLDIIMPWKSSNGFCLVHQLSLCGDWRTCPTLLLLVCQKKKLQGSGKKGHILPRDYEISTYIYKLARANF
jgi:hypothetical protein